MESAESNEVCSVGAECANIGHESGRTTCERRRWREGGRHRLGVHLGQVWPHCMSLKPFALEACESVSKQEPDYQVFSITYFTLAVWGVIFAWASSIQPVCAVNDHNRVLTGHDRVCTGYLLFDVAFYSSLLLQVTNYHVIAKLAMDSSGRQKAQVCSRSCHTKITLRSRLSRSWVQWRILFWLLIAGCCSWQLPSVICMVSKVTERAEVDRWVIHGFALNQVSVLGGDGTITVHDATLIGIDASHDLAVLKVDNPFSCWAHESHFSLNVC